MLAKRTRAGERVGVLLPTSRAAVVTFFALQAKSRVPAMLNFSTGPAAGRAACAAAEIRLVITARRFIERAKLEPLVAALAESATVVYLEDIRGEIGIVAQLSALVRGRALVRKPDTARANDPAVVLFTSGSEGTPKGVVLSHRNLLANRHQLASVIDVNPKDIVLNALPVFHSFGLTGGLLLPLLRGREDVSLPVAAPLSDRARARVRHQRDDPVRHRHVSRRLRARGRQLRLLLGALCLRGRGAREAGDATRVVREIRHPHSRRLRRHRNRARASP